MVKLVVIKLWSGSFEEGFPVSLQIGNDGERPSIESVGMLPPAPEIPQHYTIWTTAYRRLGVPYRLEAKISQPTNVAKIDDCSLAANVLRDRLNVWLNSEPFRAIREKLLEQLVPADEIRFIIQTEDVQLRKLPWHLWELCDRYPKAEIALSAPVYERVEQLSSPIEKVRILAILGNSTGINTQADRILLEQLPNAEVRFLVEPQREELTEQLWKQGWDILFFAGHSSSQKNGGTGQIYINQTESLSIEELKYGLKKAVERGLKIAIFNSCDGLGLAKDLASLHIPQIIVMREPVPDKVAQEFLKSFLEAFARGESFYLAVREARERLQGLEAKFPCATWLPIVCQNPAVLPPTWQGIVGKRKEEFPILDSPVPSPSRTSQTQPQTWRGRLRVALLASVAIASLIAGVRHQGMLQSIELKAFDQILTRRPDEKPDPRLLVITITEADVQAQNPEQRRGSLSDPALNQLLQKLEQYKPRAIGLDIYRDFPALPSQKDLANRLRQSDRLIGICKVSDPQAEEPGIPPPPEIPTERLGFSDFMVDSDGVVRRHLLSLKPDPASPCTAYYAFSAQLAFRYLAAEGIVPTINSEGFLQLGKVVFKPLESFTGGYQGTDAWGHQVLLNYRSHRSPENIADRVTLREVLNGQIDPNSIKDRIVLIGTSANSFHDYWLTPYSQGQWTEKQMPGVFVQAQMVSQMISAVKDGRSLLWVWPQWGEVFWIWGWSLLGGLFVCYLKSPVHLGIAIAAAQILLYGLCLALLIQSGCWVPLVPPALALVASSTSVAVYATFRARR
ncbi:CHASE2 domain-containing protein [Coleofasciculus sp. FACHB-64]|uniref:CHASE2 domain-containing protein n=2 Tax=Cyanophyceae TaxID=3028117 RepID=UPI001684A8C1|nr:CHASE2 domain-containing protein [Coleofasciculus sp. FACHB-64]MBD1838222.1 CHASE2 domain-containing protein [Coleofasciculus sp. FACHB-501]MBD2046106.1 CHASE2 domain-containing protein [Coleofasciculus sp. FACHB-64]